MALGKTIQYTPFQETSFAYGATELATNYSTEFPNSDDTVKIIIEHTSGNWDETGHISTPSSGTAISFYNKGTDTWTVTGERDDVDVVLSELKFFPADHPESRPKADDNTLGFQVLRFKQNQTDGSYTNENPPAIGDTVFSIKAYDGSDVQQVSQTLTFDPTEPTYDNERPYFSTEPATDDYSASSFDSSDGNLLDFGTINHGSDTDNITVTVYFRNYSTADLEFDTQGNLNTSSFIQSNELGQFLNLSDIYINDKKASELDDDSLFKLEFTGSLKECQTFIDNIKYKTKGTNQQKTFQMVVTVDDGAVGSALTKTLWHDKTLSVGVLPNQSFKEDTTTKFDLGDVDFDNKDDLLEVTSYKAVITLDSTGQGGATSFGTTTDVATDTYSSGVLTIIDSNFNTLKTAVRNLEFVPQQDFADDFTFTVQFTFENTTIGSSYTHTAKTVNVTAQEQAEAINTNVTHNWNEDQVYYFKFNNPIQIIHPYNETFDVSFDLGSLDKIGDIDTTSTASKTKTIRDNIITFNGTRDNLNSVLQNLTFIPNTDYDQSFDLDVTITRKTGGNLANADITTGTLTMTANAQEEYSRANVETQSWEEDTDKVDFATGITILDTSTEDPLLPAYGTEYKMSLRAKYYDDDFATSDVGSEMSWSCFNSSGCTVSGSGTTSDPLVITGNREDMNIAINSLRMVPDADFTAANPFLFEYKLERGEPENEFYALYTDWGISGLLAYSFEIVPSVNAVYFEKGTPSPELESPSEVKFGLERLTSLDEIEIVDVAKNKQYELNLTIDNDGEGKLRATARGSATVNWNADNKRLEISGNKTDINYTLLSLEYIPAFEFNTDFKIYIFQQQTTDDINQVDGSRYIDMVFDPTLLKYQLDLDNNRYKYEEDLLFQKNAFTYSRLKNLDGAEEITDEPIHYVTTLRTNPTTQLYFSYDYAESGALESDVLETRASEITFTGSRDYCNEKIRNLVISAHPDQIGDVDVIYTQERWRNGYFDEIQANELTALTITSSGDQPEASYTNFKQYFTTEGAETVNGQEATPRYLEEYATDENGNVINPYTRPVTIYDKASEPEGDTLYTVETVSSNLLPGMYIEEIPYKTKTQFHNYIKDGIRLIAPESLYEQLKYRQEFKVVLRVKRKLATGTEEVFEKFSLTYQYIPRPRAYNFRTSSFIDNITLSNEIYKEVRDFDATVQYDMDAQSDNTYWSFVYPAELERYDSALEIFDKHHDVIDAFFPFIGDFQVDVTTDITNASNSDLKLETKKLSARSSQLKIWMKWFNYTETPFEDVDYKEIGSVPIKHNIFEVTPLGVNVSDNFTHEVSNHWGLKGKLDISYKEQVVVHTELFQLSNSRFGNASEPRDLGKRKDTLGHDSAGLNGCWSVPGQYIDEYANNTESEVSGVTLVNNIWVSPEGYGYQWGDTESVFRRNSCFPLAMVKNSSFYNNYMRSYLEVENYGAHGNGMYQDFRMRTPHNVFDFGNHKIGNYLTGYSKFFGVATCVTNLGYDRIKYVTNAEWAKDTSTTGNAMNSRYFTVKAATQFVGGTTNKHLTHFVFGDGLDGGMSAKDSPEPINYNKTPFPCTISGVTFNDDGSTSAEWEFSLTGFLITEEVYIGGDDDDSAWEERPRLNWFKKVPYNPQYEESTHTHGMRYDVQVNKASTVKQKCFINGESKDVYVPSEILCVRSYYYNYKTYNEAVVLVAKVPSDPDENLGVDKPVYEAKLYVSDVKNGNLEMNMWARRNEFDNTSRILNVQYGHPTRSNFILPTGEYIDAKGAHNFKDKPLYNLKTDLRGKKIDNFIEVYKDTFAYVSVDEGVIDDGAKNIDISFDNMLTADKKFNYAYVAKDPFDKTKLYIQLKDTDYENTYYVFQKQSNKSKLIYINLEV